MNSKDSISFKFRYVIDVEVNWGQKKILVQRTYILQEKEHILSGTNTDGIAKGQRGLEDGLRIWPNRNLSHPLFLSGQQWGLPHDCWFSKEIEQGRMSKHLKVLSQVTSELKCSKFSIYFCISFPVVFFTLSILWKKETKKRNNTSNL